MTEPHQHTTPGGERKKYLPRFVSDKSSTGRGALYTRPDEPSSIRGVIIDGVQYDFHITLLGKIKAIRTGGERQ
jgi:hypothetical protein